MFIMYPVLILREEIVCLIILMFLAATSVTYGMGKDRRAFMRLTIFAFVHVVFDIITILTVNDVWHVSSAVNMVFHIVFYFSAILFAREIFEYVIKICYGEAFSEKVAKVDFIPAVLYLISLFWIKIEYVQANGTMSSSGPAAIIGFGLAFLYFFTATICIMLNYNKLSRSVKLALVPMITLLILAEGVQIAVREFLFTGGAVTIVTVGFFFSLENPVHVLEQKVLTDALTGVKSRHSYIQDMEEYEKEFAKEPSDKFIFSYCDINKLREVNNQFGHDVGDKYILIVTQAITSSVKNAKGIYRLGGDEFLIVYVGTDANIAREELNSINDKLSYVDTDEGYQPSVSLGMACSTPNNTNLASVVRIADYYMYENKLAKHSYSISNEMMDRKLNIEGLTGRLFDAMCSSNEKSYPFITNLETNVTRISPNWSKFFGLDEEFFGDFNGVWLDYVHPDDRQAYVDDITATINGRQHYHNCEYRARCKNGEYVMCSCHGAVYHGDEDIPDIFAGFLVNHGVVEKYDPITGYRNFLALDDIIQATIDEGRTAYVLKLIVHNMAKINMLYGYDGGHTLMSNFGAVLLFESDGMGDVFCDNAVNFTIYFPNSSPDEIEEYYNRITIIARNGIPIDSVRVPIDISGGVTIISRDITPDIRTARSRAIAAAEDSAYNRFGKLVFYSDKADGDSYSNTDFKLLSHIHMDAIGERKNFFLRYQPIVDTNTGKIKGAEALIRYSHPELGEINPSRFISFLENDPSYYGLGIRIIERAVEFAKHIREKIPDFTINVNITSLQIKDETFIDTVSEMLERQGYRPADIILELTERCKSLDKDYLAARIAEFRAKGFKVAFDDVGTGFSSLYFLMDIPFDEVKLDKSFIDEIDTNPLYSVFIEALFDAAGVRPFLICFEGVENEHILENVQAFGSSLSQGYIVSTPLKDSEFDAFLEKYHRFDE